MDIALILSTLAAAREMAGMIINERDAQKVATLKVDLTEKINTAQLQLTGVIAELMEKEGQIRDLGDKVRTLEAAQQERQRYSLARLGTHDTVFAYRLRDSSELAERTDEPPHFLCQPCLDIRNAKSILQIDQDGTFARCRSCDSVLQLKPLPSLNFASTGRNYDPYGY